MSGTRKDSFRDSFESAMRRHQASQARQKNHSRKEEDFMDEYEEDLEIEEELEALSE